MCSSHGVSDSVTSDVWYKVFEDPSESVTEGEEEEHNYLENGQAKMTVICTVLPIYPGQLSECTHRISDYHPLRYLNPLKTTKIRLDHEGNFYKDETLYIIIETKLLKLCNVGNILYHVLTKKGRRRNLQVLQHPDPLQLQGFLE